MIYKYLQLNSTGVSKSSFINIAIHYSFFFTLLVVFYLFNIIPELPNSTNISQWDANWYKSIVDSGYSYDPDKQSNAAFFPLFPLIWRFLGLSTIGISLFNGLCLVSGVLILKRVLKFPNWQLYLYLSIRSLLFTFTPFSEGVFFLALATAIYGFYNRFYIALIGIFLACLTRSAAYTFAPVFLMMFVMNISRENIWKELSRFIALLSVSFLGVIVAKWLQYLEIGEWLGVFDVFKHWHREISLPVFYLTTWDGSRLLWLDGSAFFIGLSSLLICVLLFIRKILGSKERFAQEYLFSVGYLAVVTSVIVLYAYKDATGGTSIFSLNRYVFATAPFLVFLSFLFNRKKDFIWSLAIFSLSFILCWFAFGGPRELNITDVYWSKFLMQNTYIFSIGLFCLSFLIMARNNFKSKYFVFHYLVLLGFQLLIFMEYLKGYWIG